ncbi:MAG TPA: 50S ribosomal protein L16 [Nitrososphaerales archaeon]|nr:50S ribosomal protein L16 [Nitrososphaerales archaeon]
MHGKNYRQWKGQFYSKKFAPGAPNSKVARFTTGKSRPDYDDLFKLISEGKVQIRHNALEAARVAASKKVALIGEENFFLKVVTYPHVVLRENKMIATAGADRLQEGMRKAFGKPIGLAARVDIGDTVLELSLKAENFEKGKEAMKAASTKLPMKTHLEIVKLEKPVEAPAQPESIPS